MLISGALENAEAWSNGFAVRVLLLGVTATSESMECCLGDTAKHWANGFARSGSLTTIQVSNRLLKPVAVRAPFFPLLHSSLVGLWYLPAIDLLLGLRKDRRCLHDWVCGTSVVSCSTRT